MPGFDDWLRDVNRVNTAINFLSGDSSAISTGFRREGYINLATGHGGEALVDFALAGLTSTGSSTNSSSSFSNSSPRSYSPAPLSVSRRPRAKPKTQNELLTEMDGIILEIKNKATNLEKKAKCHSDIVILNAVATDLEKVCKLVRARSVKAEAQQSTNSAPNSVSVPVPSAPPLEATQKATDSSSPRPVRASLPSDQKDQKEETLHSEIHRVLTSLQEAQSKLSKHRRSWWGPTFGKIGFILSSFVIIPVAVGLSPLLLPFRINYFQSLWNFIERGYAPHTNPNSFFARDSVKKVHKAENKLKQLSNLLKPS